MNYTYLLLLLLTLITLFHSGLLVKNVCGSFISFNSPENKETNFNKSPGHSKKRDFVRTIISIPFLITPILLYNIYAIYRFENVSIHNVVLIIFIMLTGYFTYIHHYKLWSDKFREDINPIDPIGKLNDKISHDKSILEKEILFTKAEIEKTNKDAEKIKIGFEQLKQQSLKKLEKKKETENQSFESYFLNIELFEKVIELLTINGFYNDRAKHTVLHLCILTAKLKDLKLIKINRKNKHFCLALAKRFKIEPFQPSNLSTVLTDHKKQSFGHTHKDIL